MCITAHITDPDTYKIYSVCLDFFAAPGSHTGEFLATHFVAAVTEMGIEKVKIKGKKKICFF